MITKITINISGRLCTCKDSSYVWYASSNEIVVTCESCGASIRSPGKDVTQEIIMTYPQIEMT